MASKPKQIAAIILIGLTPIWCAVASLASDQDVVRDHAAQSFEQFKQRSDHTGMTTSNAGSHENQGRGGYTPEQYVIGVGQGDMTKGPIVCQRVSELSARTDLAKQIRIFVKEHMVDRVRDRTGKDPAQDIELTREEIVQEYLQGVKIIDRQIDEEKKICTATAVMPRNKLQPLPPPNDPSPPTPIVR